MPSFQESRLYCTARLTESCRRLMQEARRAFALSERGCDRVLKVARTIADLAQSEQIEKNILRKPCSTECLIFPAERGVRWDKREKTDDKMNDRKMAGVAAENIRNMNG